MNIQKIEKELKKATPRQKRLIYELSIANIKKTKARKGKIEIDGVDYMPVPKKQPATYRQLLKIAGPFLFSYFLLAATLISILIALFYKS